MQTKHDLAVKTKAEERKPHRMAKVHDLFKMWQGSDILCAAQIESCAQNKQMTTVQCISDNEEIMKASWSNFQHDGAAAPKLSER